MTSSYCDVDDDVDDDVVVVGGDLGRVILSLRESLFITIAPLFIYYIVKEKYISRL